MRRTIVLLFGIQNLLACVLAQQGKSAPQAQPTFEVVSIKPCPNWTGENGSGRVEASGTRFTMQCHSVDEMIRDAYRLYARGTPWPTNPLTLTLVPPMSPALMFAPIQGSKAPRYFAVLHQGHIKGPGDAVTAAVAAIKRWG